MSKLSKPIITKYLELKEYITKDNSIIKELMHPKVHGNSNQSLAEAIIPPYKTTFLHIHKTSEEIYHVLEGQGKMTLGENIFHITKGDTILIPPNTPHQVTNTEDTDLKILCCCAPPYSHEDTEILE
ncbi:Mannose-6-phosphate isomerase, cupin superfamily [Desulfonauticus submarinus]|uniref:Mannose-6-phosphate isomerase, cupin superfamily n=1 Tax=Desulfonauticus submarinus TaxID=206665 RepID=A0A1H0FHP0_9BACT|nr:cupin domain-containing protein [Desulfonauticus submarinus]SDN94193.1 Mannose-6-phosphate isomerase, cupin superfamily [Desulfonauticus submarinus]